MSLKLDVSDHLMFSTVDSAIYRLTGHEFYKLSQTGYSYYRPFLYPLLISLIHKVFDFYGLWIMQFIFWISAVNLILWHGTYSFSHLYCSLFISDKLCIETKKVFCFQILRLNR